jgi:hypothetical protein
LPSWIALPWSVTKFFGDRPLGLAFFTCNKQRFQRRHLSEFIFNFVSAQYLFHVTENFDLHFYGFDDD